MSVYQFRMVMGSIWLVALLVSEDMLQGIIAGGVMLFFMTGALLSQIKELKS